MVQIPEADISEAFSNLSVAEEKRSEGCLGYDIFCKLHCYCDLMTRPEGAVNKKPTKADILEMLKSSGFDCSFVGRNEGAAVKKSDLEAMATKAGTDLYGKKRLMSKKPVIISHQDLTGHTSLDQTFPGASSNNNTAANRTEDSTSGEVHLNQEGSKNIQGTEPARNIAITGNDITWYPQLVIMGYSVIPSSAPNLAVQTVIGCILNMELHKYIISKEREVMNIDDSVVAHLGMSGFLSLAANFMKERYNIEACKELIDGVYSRLNTIQINATEREANNLRVFIKCLTALERANGVKFTFPSVTARRVRTPLAVQNVVVQNAHVSNCLFNIDMLTDEQKAAFGIVNQNPVANPVVNDDEERLPINMLNFFNCGRFPIMTPREVESHGRQYKHAIWKSKNLGVLAPISVEAWRSLASIENCEINDAYNDADKFIRSVDKLEITLPFPAKFLGLECSNSMQIFIGQKAHQARMEERRHEFYIKKMWRTFCPFVKCKCDRTAKENGDCPDTIVWLDHAIWFLMNNLDKAWPEHAIPVRFAFFTSVLSTKPFKDAILAYVGYLRVRDILMKMTIRFADDANANLSAEFGGTPLTDILEKTVKPIKFLIAKMQQQQGNNGENCSSGNRKRSSEPDSPDGSIIMPPKMYRKPEPTMSKASGNSGTEVISLENYNIDDDWSVTKNKDMMNKRMVEISPCSLDMTK